MNSSNYQLLLSSMDVLYRLALVVIFIVAAVGVAIIILFVQSMIRPLTQLPVLRMRLPWESECANS